MTDTYLLYDGPLVKRQDSLASGAKRYFTGIPCKRGHIDQRYTNGSRCVSCARDTSYTRSLLPEVKAKNKKNKQKPEYKKQQRDYAKKKLAKNNPSYKPNTRRCIGITSDNPEYHRLYYHVRRSEDKSFGKPKDRSKRARYASNWTKEYRNTPIGKSISFMHKCIGRCLVNKTDRTELLLGYTREDLMLHLEKQFADGMSWDNHGEWHIDHIIPVSWFVQAGVNDPRVVNKLTNLRPLWAKDNMSKGGVRRRGMQKKVVQVG